MAESTVLNDLDMGKVERHCRYLKAKMLEDHKTDGTDQTLQSAIAQEQTIVFTKQSTSYVNIADYVALHINEKSSEQMTRETLMWVRIAT